MGEEVLGDGEEGLALPPQPRLLLQGEGRAQDAADDAEEEETLWKCVRTKQDHVAKLCSVESRRISRLSDVLTAPARQEFYRRQTRGEFWKCSLWGRSMNFSADIWVLKLNSPQTH